MGHLNPNGWGDIFWKKSDDKVYPVPSSMMLFKAATGLAVLLAVLIYRSGRVAWHHILTAPTLPSAYYTGGNVTSHCALLTDPDDAVNFCEDIAFWDHLDSNGTLTHRRVLIGCDPNRKAWNTVMGPLHDPNPRGHLFLYDPPTSTLHRLALVSYPPTHDFHPLGMDVYPSHDGGLSNVFIVNHARDETTMEQFVLDPERPDEVRYVRTLRSPYFISPNSVVMTSPTSFFMSQDHLMTRRLPNPIGHVLPVIESLAGLPLGWVSHVSVHEGERNRTVDLDGSDEEEDYYTLSQSFVAHGIPFANGVTLSPCNTHLAVAATSVGLVHFYTMDANATTTASTSTTAPAPLLTFSHSVAVPFLPDNIVFDDDGALIVTGHPHFPSLVNVAANKTGAMAPSWAVSLTPVSSNTTIASNEDGDTRAPLPASKFVPTVTETHVVETLFQSDGSVFGSSSTTLRDVRTGRLYIAGLYEKGILICQP